MTKLRGDIIDVVGEGKIRVVVAKTLFGGEFKIDLIPRLLATNGCVHAADQFLVAANDEAHGQITVLKDATGFIGDTVGQADIFAILDTFFAHMQVT